LQEESHPEINTGDTEIEAIFIWLLGEEDIEDDINYIPSTDISGIEFKSLVIIL